MKIRRKNRNKIDGEDGDGDDARPNLAPSALIPILLPIPNNPANRCTLF